MVLFINQWPYNGCLKKFVKWINIAHEKKPIPFIGERTYEIWNSEIVLSDKKRGRRKSKSNKVLTHGMPNYSYHTLNHICCICEWENKKKCWIFESK